MLRDNPPAQTSRLGAGLAIMPRTGPTVPRGMPSRRDPDSPSPSSRRGTSAHSLMLPPAVLSYARSPSPDFDVPPDLTGSRLPALQFEGTNVLPTPSLSSRSSGSAQSKQGESSKTRRSGRKRSHEEFVANEARPEAESSKCSRTRTNSE
ncbi:hypothetical protein DAEQUDRAFT_172242 [Daedalea quercina L-15889]|uniref:Uncharacterized protein n=1 Tax=Daedalea quercina L-15889 TaxID=1314783 RepID=A0A165KJE2_9APHY|nr:hypothetical protein DAEQUDRAFT_172242 [Daedalea quercina L-15889]